VRWQQAAQREGDRYGVDKDYVQAGLNGTNSNGARLSTGGRSRLDWILIFTATAIFVALGSIARIPELNLNMPAALILSVALLLLLAVCGTALWKVTRFN
jgi:hypothetical protein